MSVNNGVKLNHFSYNLPDVMLLGSVDFLSFTYKKIHIVRKEKIEKRCIDVFVLKITVV